MSRKDAQLDAMLRHLGAAYYDSLHGRAADGDVGRAIDQVAGRMGENPPGGAAPLSPQHAGHAERPPLSAHHGRTHSRVRDVMTTEVVTVDRITTFKEIARLLVEHRISGVPVLAMGRHVVGVVTGSDLIVAKDKSAGTHRRWTGLLRNTRDNDRYSRLTAEKLMTSPAVTVHPDATIAAAAGLMHDRHLKWLPVVDPNGMLIGLISRRDVLNLFLVPDADLGRHVRDVLAEALPGESARVKATVHGGVVTLSGQPDATAAHGRLAAAIDLIWEIDGVVDVIDHVSQPQPT